MDFFESIPQPPSPEPPRRPRRRPWMQPEAVIPGSVPAELLLVRSESAGVAVGSLRAYANGFEFTLHVRLRREDEEYRHGMSDPFDWHASGRGGTTRDQALRLGILYADERRAASTSRPPMLPDGAEAGELVLQQGGSSGSDRRWDGDFWVHPLPPDGPVTFVAAWLAYGGTETVRRWTALQSAQPPAALSSCGPMTQTTSPPADGPAAPSRQANPASLARTARQAAPASCDLRTP